MRAAALVSVHDVAPSTLPEVLDILELLAEAGVPPPTLLVIPGRAWTRETLTVLDMHAAHERLRYAELKRAAAGKSAASQAIQL